MEISVTLTHDPKPLPEGPLGFGRCFTDHMFTADFDPEIGWHHCAIRPFENLSLHPASTVFHYGAEVFEGLKAYRTPAGGVQLFRPWDNIARLNDSAERLGLPAVPEELLMEAMVRLVQVERRWVPEEPGTSLYLRPFLMGVDEQLGVHGIEKAKLIIIASPVGSYHKHGLAPVKIAIEDRDVRAVRGGTGYAKCGGNYAAATRATNRAEAAGFDQVLWLDGVERRYIEEVGAMNVMFAIGDTVVTPSLTGSILPGITRRSCIQVLKDHGYTVEERRLSVEELLDAARSGNLKEAWGCGTAAVISPIGLLAYQGESFPVCGGEIGPISRMLYDTLTGIQYGRLPDPHGWVRPIA